MCLSLFKNRFSIIGLLIYLIPPLAFWGYIFVSTPVHGSAPVNGSPVIDIFFIAFLVIFVISLIMYPLFLVSFHLWAWSLWLALYYAIAYGFLYLYWRRCKQKQKSDVINI